MNGKLASKKLSPLAYLYKKHFNKKFINPIKRNIFTEQYRLIIFIALTGFVLADIYLSPTTSDITFFSIIMLFVISAYFYKLKSKVSFAVCLVLLFLMYGSFLISGTSDITEKIAVWLFIFMLVGIIQQWLE